MKVCKQAQHQKMPVYYVMTNNEVRAIEGPFATRSAARNWVRERKTGEAAILASRRNNLSADAS